VLSPNARNFVRDSCGTGAATTTWNVHERVVGAVSVAVHCTSVLPTGNNEPEVRVQLTWTDPTPPDVIGAANVTATGLPLLDVEFWFGGHAIASPDDGGGGGGLSIGGGGVGGLGEVGAEHALVISVKAISAQTGHARCLDLATGSTTS
jgi:hypothetical protein